MGTNYRRDIDGLRAIAVSAVVLYHAGLLGITGGFVGVDAFFVISGYLITGILRREIEHNARSLVGFYERRARRILPALFVMIAACYLAAFALYLPAEFADFSKSVIAVTAFVSNVWFWRSASNYFATEPEASPLLHTWSLGVEEQFYLAFPLLLVLLARWRNVAIVWFVAGLSLASFLLSVYAVEHAPSAAFYLAPTRAWELGLGALVALGVAPPRLDVSWRREALAAAGLLALVLPLFLFDWRTPFPGVSALLPCLGAAALLAAGSNGATVVGRLLSFKPVAFIGLISYSLYLWHWPILSFESYVAGIQTKYMTMGPRIAAVAISVFAAIVSYLFIERPFRDRTFLSKAGVFAISAATMVGAVAAAAIVVLDHGLSWRIPMQTQRLLGYASKGSPLVCTPRFGGSWCFAGAAHANDAEFVVWGDSHAGTLGPAIDFAAKAVGKRGVIATQPGCAPLQGLKSTERPGSCTDFNAGVLSAILAKAEIKQIFLVGFWNNYVVNSRREYYVIGDGSAQKRWLNAQVFETQLRRTVEALRAANREVVVVADVPTFEWNVPRSVFLSQRFGVPLPTAPTATDYAAQNAEVMPVFARLAAEHQVAIIPIADVMCRPDCAYMHLGKLVYSGNNHITVDAAQWLGPVLADRIWGAQVQ